MLLDPQTFPSEISVLLGPISRLDYPPQGDTSAVAVVSAANGKYVVKCSRGERFGSWIRREYDALKALEQAPFPTPQAHIYVQREWSGEFEAWLVMSYLSGDPVLIAVEKATSEAERLRILRAFGCVPSLIHRSPVPPGLRSDRNLVSAAYNVARYATEGNLELLAHLKQCQPASVPSTLIHGDFTVDNVLIVNGNVTGVIDWAGGGGGDPRYDLALAIRPKKTGLFHAPQDRQAFFEGYGLADLSATEYRFFVDLYAFF